MPFGHWVLSVIALLLFPTYLKVETGSEYPSNRGFPYNMQICPNMCTAASVWQKM